MVYWRHNILVNDMNQIEFIEELKAATSNTVDTAFDLATKVFVPEMHMDRMEFIISTAVVAGMIIFYFCNKLISRDKEARS